jgi:hypothetical protein
MTVFLFAAVTYETPHFFLSQHTSLHVTFLIIGIPLRSRKRFWFVKMYLIKTNSVFKNVWKLPWNSKRVFLQLDHPQMTLGHINRRLLFKNSKEWSQGQSNIASVTFRYIKLCSVCLVLHALTRRFCNRDIMHRGPPLWSSGQCSWLLTQRSGFGSRRYQIFWVAMGLERGPLSPCESKWGAIWKKISGSGLQKWD